MNLYLLRQTEVTGYDTFDSAVVAAESEADARTIDPGYGPESNTWASGPDRVEATYLGVADASIERGVVLASFNAG